MPDRCPDRPLAFMLGLAAVIFLPLVGCGGGGDSSRVEASPEVQKKAESYIQNYQQKMLDQHKGKAAAKKP